MTLKFVIGKCNLEHLLVGLITWGFLRLALDRAFRIASQPRVLSDTWQFLHPKCSFGVWVLNTSECLLRVPVGVQDEQ
jgi:hypothetical protein